MLHCTFNSWLPVTAEPHHVYLCQWWQSLAGDSPNAALHLSFMVTCYSWTPSRVPVSVTTNVGWWQGRKAQMLWSTSGIPTLGKLPSFLPVPFFLLCCVCVCGGGWGVGSGGSFQLQVYKTSSGRNKGLKTLVSFQLCWFMLSVHVSLSVTSFSFRELYCL